jgi:hypothetical protein
MLIKKYATNVNRKFVIAKKYTYFLIFIDKMRQINDL